MFNIDNKKFVLTTTTIHIILFLFCANVFAQQNKQTRFVVSPHGDTIQFELVSGRGDRNPELDLVVRDGSGYLVWEKTIQGSGELIVGHVGRDGPNVVVTGSFTGSIELGSVRFEAAQGFDTFLAVYSVEGDLLRAWQVGGLGDAFPSDLVLDSLDRRLAVSYEGVEVWLPLSMEPMASREPLEFYFEPNQWSGRLLRVLDLPVGERSTLDSPESNLLFVVETGDTPDPPNDPSSACEECPNRRS